MFVLLVHRPDEDMLDTGSPFTGIEVYGVFEDSVGDQGILDIIQMESNQRDTEGWLWHYEQTGVKAA